MAVPFIFATMPGGNVPASDLDANFAACVLGSGAGFTMTRNTAYLSADVPMSVQSQFYPGPTLNVGTTGVFLVCGYVTVYDTGGGANFQGTLDDGVTNFATGQCWTGVANAAAMMSFSALVTNPAGTLEIRCRDINSTTGIILSNVGTFGAQSCALTALRVG